jgi:hypothetical protein
VKVDLLTLSTHHHPLASTLYPPHSSPNARHARSLIPSPPSSQIPERTIALRCPSRVCAVLGLRPSKTAHRRLAALDLSSCPQPLDAGPHRLPSIPLYPPLALSLPSNSCSPFSCPPFAASSYHVQRSTSSSLLVAFGVGGTDDRTEPDDRCEGRAKGAAARDCQREGPVKEGGTLSTLEQITLHNHNALCVRRCANARNCP